MGFDKSIEIRRKSQEFEMSMKKRISNPYKEEIVTGSKADGFRDGKSDEDYLVIFKDVKILDLEEEVVQYRNMRKKITLKINKDPEYWEDGYVLLKYISGGSDTLPKHVHCINCSKLNGFVSSHRFKKSVLDMRKNESLNNNFFIHGPCISYCGLGKDIDIAYSFECNFWPLQAKEWIRRPRLWPSQKLVNEIVQNGCHVVPLGPLKDVKGDMLWRLSFNNAEQRLVFAFNHTQFLCYGLLKAVMKECIQKMESYPANTLCSYFIKTLMFWMIQDTAIDLWQPNNILICYVVCLVRLLVWVNNEECPNFFIPSRNMLKIKVTEQTKKHLLNTMAEVFKMGVWKTCARCSKCFSVSSHFKESDIPYYRHYYINVSFFRECRHLSSHFIVNDQCYIGYLNHFSDTCSTFPELKAQFFKCSELSMYQNLAIRQLSLRCQIQLLKMAKSLDLTRGPLMLATCLYCAKKYTSAMKIVEDTKKSLGIFTFFAYCGDPHIMNIEIIHWLLGGYVISPQNLRYSLREKRENLLALDIIILRVTDSVKKTPNWRNIPDEIHFDLLFHRHYLIIHPLVYLYFLCFLCNKHQKKMDNALAALKQLEYLILNICKNEDTAEVHLILGIIYEEVKRYDEAVYQYDVSYSLRSSFTSALIRSDLVRKFVKLCCPKVDYNLD